MCVVRPVQYPEKEIDHIVVSSSTFYKFESISILFDYRGNRSARVDEWLALPTSNREVPGSKSAAHECTTFYCTCRAFHNHPAHVDMTV